MTRRGGAGVKLEWPGKFMVLLGSTRGAHVPSWEGKGLGKLGLGVGVGSGSSDELRAFSEPRPLYFDPACQACQVHEWGEYLAAFDMARRAYYASLLGDSQLLQPFLQGIPFWCVSYSLLRDETPTPSVV